MTEKYKKAVDRQGSQTYLPRPFEGRRQRVKEPVENRKRISKKQVDKPGVAELVFAALSQKA